MVGGDYLSGIAFVPSFLKHASDIGITVADLVAPAFVFVIGLNFGPSFARRSAAGVGSAYRYFVTRYLMLVGIGAIISAGSNLAGQPSDWGVLQALGVAGLICVLFIRLPAWARLIVGAVMLVGYQYLLDTTLLDAVLPSVHGGLFGAVSWAGLLILSTAVADVWRKGLVPYLLCCLGLAAAGGISLVLVSVSKHRVSLSFVLITLAISALVFLVIDVLSRYVPARAGLFCWWGENALALYLAHLVILALFVAPPIAWWYVEAPWWLAALQLAVILSSMSGIAWWLTRRRKLGSRHD